MNSKQAKQINFPDLLSRLGHEPVKITKGGRELWYASPFRKEKTASFHTSYLGGKWIWKDFGDTGGNVIDFVMRYQGIQFKDALAFLRDVYQDCLFDHSSRAGHSFRQSSNALSYQQQGQVQSIALENQRELEFLGAHDIQNPVIISYLEEQRRIPADLSQSCT
jgi:DNA primase